jgi:hypothetical protein
LTKRNAGRKPLGDFRDAGGDDEVIYGEAANFRGREPHVDVIADDLNLGEVFLGQGDFSDFVHEGQCFGEELEVKLPGNHGRVGVHDPAFGLNRQPDGLASVDRFGPGLDRAASVVMEGGHGAMVEGMPRKCYR